MKLTNALKKDFFTKGWILVDMGFDDNEINYFYNGLIKLKEKALTSKYPLGRTYYPHLRSDNIAAIEAPFNKKIITQPVKDLFANLNLGGFIKELMDWEEVYLPLARLFIMSSYNYRGDWHRDYNHWKGTNKDLKYVQCAIYLKDQPGFRLFKLNYDIHSKSSASLVQSPAGNIMPLKINQEFYTEIPGKAGSLLLFDPGI